MARAALSKLAAVAAATLQDPAAAAALDVLFKLTRILCASSRFQRRRLRVNAPRPAPARAPRACEEESSWAPACVSVATTRPVSWFIADY
jgi:hypothetical protein